MHIDIFLYVYDSICVCVYICHMHISVVLGTLMLIHVYTCMWHAQIDVIPYAHMWWFCAHICEWVICEWVWPHVQECGSKYIFVASNACVVPCSTMCSSMYTNRSTYTCVTLDTHLYFSVYLGMLFHMITCMVPYANADMWYHVHMCGYATDTHRGDAVLPMLLQWPEKAELQDRIHLCSSGWSTSGLMWCRGGTAGCRTWGRKGWAVSVEYVLRPTLGSWGLFKRPWNQ